MNSRHVKLSEAIRFSCKRKKEYLSKWHVCYQLDFSEVDADDLHSLTSDVVGSRAEFYIKPELTCVDDLDVMVRHNDVLTFNLHIDEIMIMMTHLRYRLKNVEVWKIFPDVDFSRIRSCKQTIPCPF